MQSAKLSPNHQYIQTLSKQLSALQSRNPDEIYQAIVDLPFDDKQNALNLDLGIVVLLLVNQAAGTIDRIALSDTVMAQGAVEMSSKPFKKIRIPLGHPDNIIAHAIETGRVQQTEDWRDLFAPDLTPQQARLNQSGAGIESSLVTKLKVDDGGALIFSFFQPLANLHKDQHYDFAKQYSNLVSRVLNRSRQRLIG